MRTDQEFKEEIFERALQYKRNKTKHSFKMISVIVVLAIVINSFSSSNSTIQAVNLLEDLKQQEVKEEIVDETFINHQIDFSISLFKENYTRDNNTLISPISAMFALSMCANGATNETLKEMENVLGNKYTIDQMNSYLYSLKKNLSDEELKIANSIWFDDTFDANPVFLQKCVDYYDSEVYKTVFNQSAVNDINQWVNNKTDGMIEEIIDQMNPDTIMYLLNALSFEAEWKNPYKKYQVEENEFINLNGKREFVDMMFSREYTYLESEQATGFIKNYENNNYSFIAILPNENIDFNEYVQSFDSKEYLNLINNKQNQAVETGLPKFKYENSIELNTILNNMGIKKAFDPLNAQLMELGKSEFNLYISNVKQKTMIDVNEYGTKAFAITDLEVSDSAAENTKQVILNRPFVYMIIDNNTNLPIFIGSIVSLENPS